MPAVQQPDVHLAGDVMDVYVTEIHPVYQVWVDGKVYDEFKVIGPPLTWAQQYDVAAGYREGLET